MPANKLTDTARKQLGKLWQTHVDNVKNSTPTDLNESRAEQRARMKQLEADTEAWFSYYFPKYAFVAAAEFHTDATKRIVQNAEWYEVRMWSRELAKSTRTMMEVMYLTLVGHACEANKRLRKKYVLLISNSLDNATRLLMPYRANLEYNQRIIHDYGPQEKPGSWMAEEFTTRSGVAYRALGAGQSPRGTRHEEARPDIILFDDVDTDKDCTNSSIIARKWRWIEEAAIGTRSISGPTTIIFCGNRIASDCCVERATKFADHVDVINIRDEYGVSAWPQKNTEAHIERVLRQKSYAAQQKEYFNNPVTEGAVFPKMYYKPALHLDEYTTLVCYTDPSYKHTADYKATVLVGAHNGEYHVLKAFVEQTTTARMIEWHYLLMEYVNGRSCHYYIEEVFLQDVIKKEMIDVSKQRGIPLSIKGDIRSKTDKYQRIESLLEPLARNGNLFLNEEERHNPGMLMLEQQFLAFAPGSRTHDDGPDAVEGAVWLLRNKHVSHPAAITTIKRKPNLKRF